MSPARSLAPVVRALGGDLYAGGRRASVPGPGHSAADRSVSLWLDGARVVIHCFAGDDWRAVRADLQARGLVDAAGRLAGGAGAAASDAADAGGAGGPVSLGRAARIARALALWSEGQAVAGTLSARHAAARGIAGELPAALRHHPAVPAAVYAGAGPRRPALLALVRDAAGAPCGVEVTYLAAGGARARIALARKTVGVRPARAAVRLHPPGARLLVGEGVFTCLSAAARFGLPAWALLGAGNLRAWRPPPGVRFVLIAADRGRDGEAAARVLAGRLRALGIAAAVRWPQAPFGDWNEAAAGEAGAAGGGGRTGGGRAADGWSGPPARSLIP